MMRIVTWLAAVLFIAGPGSTAVLMVVEEPRTAGASTSPKVDLGPA